MIWTSSRKRTNCSRSNTQSSSLPTKAYIFMSHKNLFDVFKCKLLKSYIDQENLFFIFKKKFNNFVEAFLVLSQSASKKCLLTNKKKLNTQFLVVNQSFVVVYCFYVLFICLIKIWFLFEIVKLVPVKFILSHYTSFAHDFSNFWNRWRFLIKLSDKFGPNKTLALEKMLNWLLITKAR